MDHEDYISYLDNQLFTDIREKCGENWVFQRDSAPPHRAKGTVSYLERNAPEFISPECWPPTSPDLNPLDYSIWQMLVEKVYSGELPKTIEELKAKITSEWEKLPQMDRTRHQSVASASGQMC